MKAKTYAEVLFADGNSIDGFVIKVTDEDFDIITIEAILPEPTDENSTTDEDGMIFFKETDFDGIPVKHSYVHSLVYGVISDITHRMKPNVVKSLDFIRNELVYKTNKKQAKCIRTRTIKSLPTDTAI